MKLTFRYGAFNKKDKTTQKIYLINRQNNKLDFRKSLNISIDIQYWDFDNNFIIDTRKSIKPEARKTLYPIIDTLKQIETKFYRKFTELETQTMGFRSTTKDQWRVWSEECIKEVFEPKKPQEINPYLKDLMIDYKDYYETLKSKNLRHSPSTTIIWNNQIKILDRFQKDINHNFRINEITIKDFYNVFHNWCDKGTEIIYQDKEGNKTRRGNTIVYTQNTRSKFLKKVIATMKRAEQSLKYPTMSLEYKTPEFECLFETKEITTLNEDEILKVFNYSTEDKKEINLINCIKLQYECCLRYVDLIHNLGIENTNYKKGSRKNKDKKYIVKSKEAIESKITHAKTLKGSDIYKFTCIQPKIKRVNSSKIVPISNEIKDLLLNASNILELWSNTYYNRELKSLLIKLGIDKEITTHCLRKSKCTNLMNLGVTDDEIIIYSGHFSTKELRDTYINWNEISFKGKHNPNTRKLE